MQHSMQYSAFIDMNLFTEGKLETVIANVKRSYPDREAILVETETCKRLDVNWQGELTDVLSRLNLQISSLEELKNTEAKNCSPEPIKPTSAKRGRPKLGVVSKEITLLPRHWEWLAQQSGGASVTLRKLIDQARKENSAEEDIKTYQSQLYSFISIFAEQLNNVEETIRALYRQDQAMFMQSIQDWPVDIKQFCNSKFNRILALQKQTAFTQ